MIQESPLSGDDEAELRDAASELAISDLDGLDALLEAVRQGDVAADDALAFALGAWVGAEVREATGWRWVHLRLGEGLETPALVDEARALALLPLQLAADALEGHQDLRTLLERLRRGDRPRGTPGTYALVS